MCECSAGRPGGPGGQSGSPGQSGVSTDAGIDKKLTITSRGDKKEHEIIISVFFVCICRIIGVKERYIQTPLGEEGGVGYLLPTLGFPPYWKLDDLDLPPPSQ